jgi:uncharacterized protein (TIGR03084 family)
MERTLMAVTTTAALGQADGGQAANARAAVLGQLAADLAAEASMLAGVLSALRPPDWDRHTPAVGWTIRDQVTHLAFFDDATLLAIADPAGFDAQRAELVAFGDRFPDVVAAQYRHLPGRDCLAWFLRSRDALLAAYRAADPRLRLPWYGPEMSLASSVTGRLMETWAHGQDIADTLGERREPTARLRHIADLGVRTLAFNFRLRGLPVPEEKVRVELTGPGDPGSPGTQRWTWGPDGAANRVEGDAQEFCLVVTQRRNVADTALTVTGPVATRWIAIAQAFAGAATDTRPPGSFPSNPSGAPGPNVTRGTGHSQDANGGRS